MATELTCSNIIRMTPTSLPGLNDGFQEIVTEQENVRSGDLEYGSFIPSLTFARKVCF